MLNTDFSKRIRKSRKQRRELEKKGYVEYFDSWEVIRENGWREVILDVVISVDGKYIYALFGELENE